MTVQEAYQILGIRQGSEKNEIKKRYRQLMMQVHPDAVESSQGSYQYSVQEINAAYAVLMKGKLADLGDLSSGEKRHTAKGRKSASWNAPVNVNAFMEREVLQYVEDYDGAVLGTFCVAKGKYLWKTDEDFPLFLLSLYQCSKELLDRIDESVHRDEMPLERQKIQAELTYLLAQQFIDGSALLEEIARKEDADPAGDKIFYLSAMLELKCETVSAREGEMVYSSGIRNHKLYLKNQEGQELGYLSFADDRLYYIVIPLFEQKRVQVKVEAAERKTEKKQKAKAGYLNLHLWVKLLRTDISRLPENLNLRIEKLLREYKAIHHSSKKEHC